MEAQTVITPSEAVSCISDVEMFHLVPKHYAELQERVQQMKKELACLVRVQKNQQKKLNSSYQNSLCVARTKINQTETHLEVTRRQSKDKTLREMKHSKVQLMREKEVRELQSIRDGLQHQKETERANVQQKSLECSNMIKLNKEKDVVQKRQKAKVIRLQHKIVQEGMVQSKLLRMKQKEEEELNKSRMLLNKEPELQREYETLLKEKQNYEEQLKRSRLANSKMVQQTNILKGLKSTDVVNFVKELSLKIDQENLQIDSKAVGKLKDGKDLREIEVKRILRDVILIDNISVTNLLGHN